MDFERPGEDDPRRLDVRVWLEAHPRPTGEELATRGYVVPHWPEPWGLSADPVHQLIIDEELARAHVRRPKNPIGIGWAGPTIVDAGTDQQRERYLPSLLSGDDIWCQLFSEPGSGSDLASLSTTAVRDGESYVINGQKVWTSLGHQAKFGILLARTSPERPKREGISYFICPMDARGIEIRKIVEMTGQAMFNEVFFSDVHLPAENLVGAENDGWRLAKVTLGNERVALSSGGALWGAGPTVEDLLDVIRKVGGIADPVTRQEVARVYAESKVLDLIRLRLLSAAINGQAPGPEASIRKVLADEHGRNLMFLAKNLAGAPGMLEEGGPLGSEPAMWPYGFLFAPALTVGGGTSEVQRNIVAERVLGLPGDGEVK